MKKEMVWQQCLWLAFIVYYTSIKYLAGSQEWNSAYALQVGLIVMISCLLPYYLTVLAMSVLPGVNRIAAKVLLPTSLALLGYFGFYIAFIQPNFPDITPWQVVPRGLFPGLVISALLLIPEIGSWWLRRRTPSVEGVA